MCSCNHTSQPYRLDSLFHPHASVLAYSITPTLIRCHHVLAYAWIPLIVDHPLDSIVKLYLCLMGLRCEAQYRHAIKTMLETEQERSDLKDYLFEHFDLAERGSAQSSQL